MSWLCRIEFLEGFLLDAPFSVKRILSVGSFSFSVSDKLVKAGSMRLSCHVDYMFLFLGFCFLLNM